MNDTEKLIMINEKLVEDLQTYQDEYVKSKGTMINYALITYIEFILSDIRKHTKQDTDAEIIVHLKHIFERDEERFSVCDGSMLFVSQYASRMIVFIEEMEI